MKRRSARRWLSGALSTISLLACGPSHDQPTPTTPAPPSSAALVVASSPPGSPAPTTSAPRPGNGWSPYPDPRKAALPPAPITDFASCVTHLRSGLWLGDEAPADLYATALEDERAGNLDGARRGYFQVISNQLASPFAPLSYLAFGELFAIEAERDPSKWELARQAYQESTKSFATTSSVLAYSLLRLADTYQRTGDRPRALTFYKQAADHAGLPDQQCGTYIREQAQQRSR